LRSSAAHRHCRRHWTSRARPSLTWALPLRASSRADRNALHEASDPARPPPRGLKGLVRAHEHGCRADPSAVQTLRNMKNQLLWMASARALGVQLGSVLVLAGCASFSPDGGI